MSDFKYSITSNYQTMKKPSPKKKKRMSTGERIEAILKHPETIRRIELKKRLKQQNLN